MRAKISDKFELCKKSGIKAGDGKKAGLYPLFTSSNEQKLFIDSYQFDFDAVVIGTGGNPSCVFGTGKYSISIHNIALKPTGDVLPKFLYYFLQKDNFSVLEKGFHGIGLKNISPKYIMNIEFDYPDIETQKKIISELDDTQEYIKGTKTKISLCDELIKSRFVEMFGSLTASVDFYSVLEDQTKKVAKLASSDYKDAGDVAIVDQGEKNICGYTSVDSKNPPYSKPCIIFGDHTERFKYVDFPFYLGADGTKVLQPKNGWNPYYVFEYLAYNYLPTGGYSRHFKFLNKLLFGRPSVELQNEFALYAKELDKLKFSLRFEVSLAEELFTAKMNRYF